MRNGNGREDSASWPVSEKAKPLAEGGGGLGGGTTGFPLPVCFWGSCLPRASFPGGRQTKINK